MNIRWRRLVGWAWIALCGLYVAFALSTAATTAMALLGLADQPVHRAAPAMFVGHAVTGSVALLCGALQILLTGALPLRSRRRHRWLGRAYVWTAWATSVLSLFVIADFDVPTITKVFFAGAAVLWFATTALAYARIRRGRVAEHCEWIIRSYAIALFFITFSAWDSILAATPLPDNVSYGLSAAMDHADPGPRHPGPRCQTIHAHRPPGGHVKHDVGLACSS
jgi:hypothetical protein